MFKVGLTGGIASGKSTVARLFAQQHQITVLDADEISKRVIAPNTPCRQAVIARYGDKILTATGELDRRKMREIIFNNTQERLWLEHQLHPAILQHMQILTAQTTGPYLIWMVPLLLEKNMQHQVDRILVVDCDPQIQIERCTQRDHISQKQVKTILATQLTPTKRRQFADDIIDNSQINLTQLAIQVAKLHEKYLFLSTSV